MDWLFHYEYEMLGIPAPELVIYLRVDPAVSQKLLKKRYEGQDKRDIHEKDKEYMIRCQEAADYCAEKLGWHVVECTSDGEMRTIEDINKEIIAFVNQIV